MANINLLKDDSIILRALEPEDLDLLYTWENNSEWWKYGNTRAPFSRYLLKQYIMSSHKDIYEANQLRLMIDHSQQQKSIGIVDMFDFDPHNRKAEVGILIDPEFQKMGFGEKAINIIKNYASSFLKIHQLYTFVPSDNISSIKLFEKCGFDKKSVLKDWIIDGTSFSDVIVMQCIF